MVDLYKIPVFYISFKQRPELEATVRSIGFNDVRWFPAIDGRKLNVTNLREKNLITIRSYNDLMTERTQHEGLPTLGAVGCTMSHSNVWKLCLQQNLPYVIILEDDVNIDKKISQKDQEFIQSFLQNNVNPVFVSANINKKPLIQFFGLQFYIVSNGACKALLPGTFPIDVQTDAYIAHIAQLGQITLGGYLIFPQKQHASSIQDLCINCLLPTRKSIYVIIGIVSVIILILTIIFFFNWIRCKSTCSISK